MSSRIFEAFDRRAVQVTEYMTGCGRKYGQECTCGPNCRCPGFCCNGNTGVSDDSSPRLESRELAHLMGFRAHEFSRLAAQAQQRSLELSQTQIAEQLTATATAAAAAASNRGRGSSNCVDTLLRGRTSGQVERGNDGRTMSGLSQLSIDWENMEDFDVDVDHSAHINNAYAPNVAGKTAPFTTEGRADSIMTVSPRLFKVS